MTKPLVHIADAQKSDVLKIESISRTFIRIKVRDRVIIVEREHVASLRDKLTEWLESE